MKNDVLYYILKHKERSLKNSDFYYFVLNNRFKYCSIHNILLKYFKRDTISVKLRIF